jgi:type IV secretion system protein VirB9
VVRVVGGTLSSTQIIFAPTETVTQVAIGDSEAWLAQPAGNLLFLKPTEVRANTNAQVVTRRANGSFRSYQFELVAHAATSTQPAEDAQFAIAFTYPGDVRAAAAETRRKQEVEASDRLAQQHLSLGMLDGPQNWKYVARGSYAIQPAEVSDNGRITAFRFPRNQTLPTIYTVAADGQETIVPYTTSGDMVLVETTAREFHLRQGKETLFIYNLAFNPYGWNTGTGTMAADVTRMIREPRQ